MQKAALDDAQRNQMPLGACLHAIVLSSYAHIVPVIGVGGKPLAIGAIPCYNATIFAEVSDFW